MYEFRSTYRIRKVEKVWILRGYKFSWQTIRCDLFCPYPWNKLKEQVQIYSSRPPRILKPESGSLGRADPGHSLSWPRRDSAFTASVLVCPRGHCCQSQAQVPPTPRQTAPSWPPVGLGCAHQWHNLSSTKGTQKEAYAAWEMGIPESRVLEGEGARVSGGFIPIALESPCLMQAAG